MNDTAQKLIPLLIQQGIQFKDFKNIFERCEPDDFFVSFAVEFGKLNPELLLSKEFFLSKELSPNAASEKISVMFEALACDKVACRALQKAVAKDPDPTKDPTNDEGTQDTKETKDVLDFITFLLRTFPLAAVTVLDKTLLQEPFVENIPRNPIPFKATLNMVEGINAGYGLSSWTWNPALLMLPWQSNLVTPTKWEDPIGFLAKHFRFHQMTSCKIRVLQYGRDHKRNISDVREICRALDGLDHMTTVNVLDTSFVLQAIISFVWRTWARRLHFLKFFGQIVHWVVLLILSFQTSPTASNWIWWSVFTAMLGVQVDDLVNHWVQLRPAPYQVAHVISGLFLCCRSWQCWSVTELDSYRAPLAINLGLTTLAILFELPYTPWPGGYIVPVVGMLTYPGCEGILAMLLVLATVVISMFLYALIQFKDIDHATAALIRSWQTLIVGEDVLWNVSSPDYSDEWTRYLVVCGAFFITLVLLSIFINITGEGYSHQVKIKKGSFCSTRLYFCTYMMERCWSVTVIVFILAGSAFIWALTQARSNPEPAVDCYPPIVAFILFLLTVIVKEMLRFYPYSARSAGNHGFNLGTPAENRPYPWIPYLLRFVCTERWDRDFTRSHGFCLDPAENMYTNRRPYFWICAEPKYFRNEDARGTADESTKVRLENFQLHQDVKGLQATVDETSKLSLRLANANLRKDKAALKIEVAKLRVKIRSIEKR
jgi:hypothetical protein